VISHLCDVHSCTGAELISVLMVLSRQWAYNQYYGRIMDKRPHTFNNLPLSSQFYTGTKLYNLAWKYLSQRRAVNVTSDDRGRCMWRTCLESLPGSTWPGFKLAICKT